MFAAVRAGRKRISRAKATAAQAGIFQSAASEDWWWGTCWDVAPSQKGLVSSAIPFMDGSVWLKAKVYPAQEEQSRGKRQGATLLQHLCVLPPPPLLLLVPPASGRSVHLKPPCLWLEGALLPIHRPSLECPLWCSLTHSLPNTAANVVGDC